MRSSFLLAASVLALVGCDLLKKNAKDDAGAAATADAAAPSVKAASAGAIGGAQISGVGEVPAWAPDKGGTAKCDPSAAAKARFKALEKGDDAAVTAGTADVAALVTEVGAETCFAARKGLAEALNNGGYKRYGAKKFDEANRWWRASLTARPSFLLARYNLACGLGLSGKGKDAVLEILEIARAAKEGDASASNFLEKAKSDDDLKSVRDDPNFKDALKLSQGTLIGPRKGASEPEVGKQALPLLPAEFRRMTDTSGITEGGVVTFKPAVVNIWTWHPTPSTELVVTTVIDDIAMVGKPRGDLSPGYGALAVYRRDGEKLTLLLAHKTGQFVPAIAAGKNGALAYTFDLGCTISGTLTSNGKTVERREKTCQDQ
ncbi:hypothetical protein BH11MYX4_BH11MYX4_06360 [soil metagenome]